CKFGKDGHGRLCRRPNPPKDAHGLAAILWILRRSKLVHENGHGRLCRRRKPRKEARDFGAIKWMLQGLKLVDENGHRGLSLSRRTAWLRGQTRVHASVVGLDGEECTDNC